MLDLSIVLLYFVLIFVVALRGKNGDTASVEAYFLSNRNLKWPSIALSTIATNIQGYQFLGMMGSAYLYGLAQASLEINAVQGILLAAFVFVPLYLKSKVITITQFIEERLGKTIARIYSIANLSLFSTITLGAALFWGAYAAELVFTEYLMFLHQERIYRIAFLIVGLGVFSAIYTYLGGLAAVVKTDIIQFIILLTGGILVTIIVLKEAGGISALYEKTPELMHLHLPADHPVLPWTHMFGLFLLNINYWCANQTVIQRSLAAKSLAEAQKGLMVGGVLKYLMAIIIVIPGIALAGILENGEGLTDPDQVFPYLVTTYLPVGIQGIVLCALFASLMSTVDSTFNSIATLWSVDMYKGWLRPNASEQSMVQQGRSAILLTLITGIVMGLVLLYLKFENPTAAFTHQLNQLRYYINCGIVVIICTVAFIAIPNRKATLFAFFMTIPTNWLMQWAYPDMNYFLRAFWVIALALGVVLLGTYVQKSKGVKFWNPVMKLIAANELKVKTQALILLSSLILIHVLLH
ncbi:MAG: SSS family solute:Na+ symporter [Cyclobacteriaceae bacterium]|jgi:SSS family solute:Na+ symporter